MYKVNNLFNDYLMSNDFLFNCLLSCLVVVCKV